jgi:hypothetical protein
MEIYNIWVYCVILYKIFNFVYTFYRAMKIIIETENDDIKGSIVTDATEYTIKGKVTKREPLEVSNETLQNHIKQLH